MKNLLECHGTLVFDGRCGCLMETTMNVPVERSKRCTNPEHEPYRKPSYKKVFNDKKNQVALTLQGSAADCK